MQDHKEFTVGVWRAETFFLVLCSIRLFIGCIDEGYSFRPALSYCYNANGDNSCSIFQSALLDWNHWLMIGMQMSLSPCISLMLWLLLFWLGTRFDSNFEERWRVSWNFSSLCFRVFLTFRTSLFYDLVEYEWLWVCENISWKSESCRMSVVSFAKARKKEVFSRQALSTEHPLSPKGGVFQDFVLCVFSFPQFVAH